MTEWRDGRDRWGMCKITENPDRHMPRAMTRADARYICFWETPGPGAGRFRNSYATLSDAIAHLARHPEWGPDHVWDADALASHSW